MTNYLRFAIILGAVFLCSLPRTAGAQAQMPNPYGAPVTVEVARKLADTALAEARKSGWTVAAAIVDIAGDLVFFERMDNTQAGSMIVSQEKARTAVRFKRTTKAFEDAVVAGRTTVLSLPGVTPIEGGVPLVVDGKIIGAIGVSGATSQQDGVCAQAAIDTLGKQIASPAPRPAAPAPAKK
jgi:glc operon protein GlcG